MLIQANNVWKQTLRTSEKSVLIFFCLFVYRNRFNIPVNLACTYYSDAKQKSHCKPKMSTVVWNLTHSVKILKPSSTTASDKTSADVKFYFGWTEYSVLPRLWGNWFRSVSISSEFEAVHGDDLMCFFVTQIGHR